MNNETKKIFWKLDDKLYLVDKNKTYKKLFKSFRKYNNDSITQEFIDKLIAWYYVKYNDKYIKNSLNGQVSLFNHSLESTMKFDKLIFRIDDMIKIVNNDDVLGYQYLVVMAGWGIIYDRNSNPYYGLYKVKKMFNDFNKYYGWNLNSNIYESIINIDYSVDNPYILKLLEIENNNIQEKNKLPKIKKLFRR